MPRQAARLFGGCVAAALLSLSLTGCGPARTDVTGQVTYNGKPLDRPGGTIAFFSPNHRPVAATIDSTGHYHAVGVYCGENKVAVYWMLPVPPPRSGSRVPKPNAPAAPQQQPDSPFLTPVSYADPETSTLTVVVENNTVYSTNLTGPNIP